MGKIFYLMGQSSIGKDTIYKKLLEEKNLELERIVTYTTRPIRQGEIDDMEYHFVGSSQLEQIRDNGKLIEVRSYQTYHGVWQYFTVDDSQIDLNKTDYLIIGTLESYMKTKEYFGEDKLIPILITLDDGVRLQRALDRERMQEEPKYQELCRRFLADAVDFSKEKIEEAGITRFFYNDDLVRIMEEIILYIIEQKN